MTGQGHTRMEQIKANRPGIAITLNREYRTASGHLVRGLQFKQTNKQLHNGQWISTATTMRIIVGQIKMHNTKTGTQEWCNHHWFEDGRHIISGALHLVPSNEKLTPQPKLF